MRTRWCVAVVAFLTLAGCAARPEAGGGGDELVGDNDPTGGGFIAVPLGPTSSSTVIPAVDPTAQPDPKGTEEWRVTRPAAGRISAYTTEISAPPGTEVGLKVSTRAGGYRVSAFRIGAYRGGSGTLVGRSPFLAGERQADPVLDPVETRTVVAPWHRSLTIDTDGWQPGYYVLKPVRRTAGRYTWRSR